MGWSMDRVVYILYSKISTDPGLQAKIASNIHVFRLEGNVSRIVAQNSLTPQPENNKLKF